jgi:hypothetical protein
MRSSIRYLSSVAVASLALTAACDDGSPEAGTATLTVALTDAADVMFEAATIEVGEVRITRSGGAPVVLTDDAGEHDLLELQDGVMADLATLDIEAGRYLQLRLEVLSASVTLAEGFEFADGSTTRDLPVPSGAQSGIKINLTSADGDPDNAGVFIASGESILVVDVDVSQNFVVQGPTDDPLAIQGVQFTPLLRASLQDVAGSISGAVTYASATPADETEFATVTADLDPASSSLLEEMQTDMVSTTVAADGTYTLWFLSPGDYDVSAAATIGGTDYSDGPQTVTVGDQEAVVGVDFTL